MDITTEFRSHWVAADGTRHASRLVIADPATPWHRTIRYDLYPIANIEELRAYADLGDLILPQSGFTSQWAARRIIEGADRSDHIVREMVRELTDDVPHYHEQWRAPFIEIRNRWPGVDGQPVVAYIDLPAVQRALASPVAP